MLTPLLLALTYAAGAALVRRFREHRELVLARPAPGPVRRDTCCVIWAHVDTSDCLCSACRRRQAEPDPTRDAHRAFPDEGGHP